AGGWRKDHVERSTRGPRRVRIPPGLRRGPLQFPVGEVFEKGGRAVATPSDVLKMLSDEQVDIVDIRFCDLPGLMQHFSIPAHELTEDVFTDGLGFDGSSIRGFQEIQESDMLLIPDADTAVIDPFTQHRTLNINCFVQDPVTGEAYSRDPRYIAKKA